MAVDRYRVLKSHKIQSQSTQPVERAARLERWIAHQFPGRDFRLAPASADASFRRYFRISFDDATLVAMDAPPPREDCRPFVRIARLMAEAGVHVPRVIAEELEQGFLLLEDLGTRSYIEALKEEDADSLFGDAIGALLHWQTASRPGVLPEYDEALLRREMQLFPDWYLVRHLGLQPGKGQAAALETVFSLLIENALGQPAVFVHRDYMPRNLMVASPNPGVLDFQDAVYGPITYDVVSLFRDAFISWDEERVLDWTVRYWEQARARRLPVRDDFAQFFREFEWMGLQRHLKVLGIFARLYYRDGKTAYLGDTPRFLGYARSVASRYDALKPLLHLLDAIEQRSAATGYTF